MLTKLDMEIRESLRHNVTVNLWDGSFFGVALGFASFSTILPLFVASMTHSALLIGLVPAIHAVGWQIPQLFTANRVSRMRRFKKSVIMTTLHERFPFLGFAIIALSLPRIGSRSGLIFTFICLIWQGLGGGFTANSWTSMISKIIPPETRGTFFGLQAGLANLFISGAAVIAGYILDWFETPFDFAACFLIACFFFGLSWVALAQTHEPEDTEKLIPDESSHFLDVARQIISKDRNFVWFMVSRFLAQFATMGFSFYIIYALRHFQMTEVVAGYFTAALTISQTVANIGMGWIGDRVGHRSMLMLGAAATLASSALAWAATSLSWFYLVYILAGIANVSIWTTGMAMTVEFGSESDRPTYIGLSQTLAAPATIFAPILGGWIADTIGFAPTFTMSMVLSSVLLAIVIFLVKNPREVKL